MTSFEIESDGNGCDIVYMNVRPVVYLNVHESTVGHYIYLLAATQKDSSGTEYATWTDGQAAHAGADYVVESSGRVGTTEGWYSGEWKFPGDSLVLANFANSQFVVKAQRNIFNRLAVYGGATINATGYSSGDSVHVIEGPCHIASGALNANVTTEGSNRRVFDFAGPLTGSGLLKFVGWPNGLNSRISGDASGFAGTIQNSESGSSAAPALIECADLNALLAPRTAIDNFALNAEKEGSGFHVTEDCTFADKGFALRLTGLQSAISVAEGKTLTVTGNIILNAGQTSKRGGGTLALAGKTFYGYDVHSYLDDGEAYFFYLYGGWVKPVAWNNRQSYYLTRFVAAASDAGFAFDAEPTDEHIAKYGLCLSFDNSITFGSGVTALPIKIEMGADATRVKNRITVPVLTVTDTLAATLEGKLTVVENFEGGTAEITSAAATDMTGFTTFSVTIKPKGFAIRIR